ncbi:MAG: leucyl/phenylalanyl-tRNA--protein transferase [Rhodanobacteraceae bacterium]|nr:leucyl/phenylalanyl-tRNA--protein transferase [Rhodanobacteraceae bacterium]
MIRIPVLQPESDEAFPAVETALREPNGLLAAGGDLRPTRLLQAYAQGIFPWFSPGEPILWWAPDPRMVFATDAMHVPRRLARWLSNCDWRISADGDFAGVMRACAAPRAGQSGTWITRHMLDAYTQLHELGHAHSVEVYAGDDCVGGIYGVAIGRMFFGESMFSRASNGSKVALLALAHRLRSWGWPLLDAQVSSAHLQTLGALELPRAEFCRRIAGLVTQPGRTGTWHEDFATLRPSSLALPCPIR